MALKNNPIYKLASDVARGVLSKEEAFEQAASPEFLKKLRKRSFKELCGAAIYGPCSQTGPEPLPRDLTTLALECARNKGLQTELLGMLNLAHGMISVQNGNIETAQEFAARAKRMLQNCGSHHAIGLCDNLLIQTHVYQGSDQILKTIKASAKQLLTRHEGSDFATRQLRLANAFSAIGEQERAIRCIHDARSHLLRLRSNNMHYRIACRKSLKKARSEFEKYLFLHDPAIINCDISMSWCQVFLRKYDAAIECLLLARKRCERNGLFGMLVLVDSAYAFICSQLGDHQEAIKILTTAQTSSILQSPTMRFQSDMALTSLYLNTEQYDSAISFLKNVRRVAEGESRFDRVAECDRKLAEIHRKLGDTDRATDLLLRAREFFVNQEMDLEVRVCDLHLAWVYAESGQYGNAIDIFRRIRAAPTSYLASALSYQCLHGSGYVLWKIGRFEEARREYAESIDLIEQVRQGSSQEELRATFLESQRRVYFEVIDCCLEQGDYAAALEYVERLKSRNLAEILEGRNLSPKNATPNEQEQLDRLRLRLRAASHRLSNEHGHSLEGTILSDFFEAREAYGNFVQKMRRKDPSFDPEHTLTVSCADIQAIVDEPSTALIELFPMRDKTVAFLVLHETRIEETTVFIEGYTEANMAQDLEAIKDKDQLEDTLRRLYDRLFIPLEPYLKAITKIVFVPYSGLHLIPLHAMFTEEDGSRKYLIDDFLVTYAPSSKVLKQCLGMPRAANQRAFVATAVPKRDLPHAVLEAESIARFLDATVHRRVSRKEIETKARDANIFHYAGHADGKALILHGQDAEHEEDRYDVGDIFVSLDLPEAWLVTLSACETGKVRLGKTDEYVGLPSAFLHAGAATVICSLWTVSDASTTLLMQRMYQEIAQGQGKAEALRKAQRWMKDTNKREEHLTALQSLESSALNKGERRIADSARFQRKSRPKSTILPEDLYKPYYWAGFICTGAP